MSTDDIRRRLEGLNRGPLQDRIKSASDAEFTSRSPRASKFPSIESLLGGAEILTAVGPCFDITRGVGDAWNPARDIHRRFMTNVRHPSAIERAQVLHTDLRDVLTRPQDQWVFVDLETCGFAGTPVFLIGAMTIEPADFRVYQLLARNYSEERSILTRFREIIEPRGSLITFNGKTFDWPFLADRAAANRIAWPSPNDHCDLLHVSRRRFRQVLPDCRLQTLERYVCGRRRMGDIPGSEIPAAYHDFARTSDARRMREIIHHNFLDLVTMADIVSRLLE